MSLKKYFMIGFSMLLMGTGFPKLLSRAGDQQEQKPIEHQVAVTVKLIQVYVTDKDGKQNIKGTPVIAKKELKKLRDPEEVLRLILERM